MVEVQIRTGEMNQTAEIGVAAHWVYKEKGVLKAKDTNINRQMRWLRELVEVLQSEESDPDEFLKLLKVDLFQDEIFVFTPKGDVIELPKNSTPVDFAYSIHSEIGDKCVAAKINGKLQPLKMINQYKS